MSPTTCVKPCPGPCRSLVGANIVPRNSTKPSGYWWLGPIACATRSSGSRLIIAIELAPSSTKPSGPSTRIARSQRRTSSMPKCSSNRRMNGPIAQRRVVVLRLAEQQRAAALEVAQVDVVAERGADRAAAGCRPPARSRAPDCSTPTSGWMPIVGAGADRRHRLRLGEDLRVGADADLEVLRPRALRDQRVLERAPPPASPGARSTGCRRSPRRSRARTLSAFAGSPRACSSITRSSMLATNVTPRGLDRLQVARREQPRLRRVARVLRPSWRATSASARSAAASRARANAPPPGSSRFMQHARRRRDADRSTRSSPCTAHEHGAVERRHERAADEQRALAVDGKARATVRRSCIEVRKTGRVGTVARQNTRHGPHASCSPRGVCRIISDGRRGREDSDGAHDRNPPRNSCSPRASAARPARAFPEAFRPADVDDALAIQTRVDRAASGSRSAAGSARCRPSRGRSSCAPIFAPTIVRDVALPGRGAGATAQDRARDRVRASAATCPPRATPYTEDEIRDARRGSAPRARDPGLALRRSGAPLRWPENAGRQRRRTRASSSARSLRDAVDAPLRRRSRSRSRTPARRPVARTTASTATGIRCGRCTGSRTILARARRTACARA